MSKFNQKSKGETLVENEAGGQAHKQTRELELVSILLTSFGDDKFYRSGSETFKILKDLISKCDPEFVAKAAIYARTKFGMRTITHLVASELPKHLKGAEWGKRFYDKIVYRPDDMLEIIASYRADNKEKMLPNSMIKGFKSAFGRFDSYSLAKYRGEGKEFKMIDAVNLVRPRPTDKNSDALKQLVKGELVSTDTWESELTRAGQNAKDENEKVELKKDVWVKLIKEKKIKYFALLRNLRNIIAQAPDMIEEACAMLVDEKAIKNSLVLPFRFTTAFDEIQKIDGAASRKVMKALNKAVEISLNNVPKFDGRTLVVLDKSGSMSGRPAQIGSLFSAVLVKSNECDLMVFSDDAKYLNYNPDDSVVSIAASMKFASGGTDFHAIFKRANKPYDRIIILSDMQGWVGHHTPASDFAEYKRRTKSNPFIYSFDLAGQGTMQFPENKIFCISGFSEKILSVMKMMEVDKKAMISEILKVEL